MTEKTIRPNAVGTYEEFETMVGGEGTDHYTTVDEESTDDDTSYVESDIEDQRDTFGMEACGLPANAIISKLSLWARMRRESILDARVYMMIISGATEQLSDSIITISGYNVWSWDHETDPNTGEAWTIAAVDAVELGLKISTGVACTQLWGVITYTVPTGSFGVVV